MTTNKKLIPPSNGGAGSAGYLVRNPYGRDIPVSREVNQALTAHAPQTDGMPDGTRFVVAFNATGSREQTWIAAQEIQSDLIDFLKQVTSPLLQQLVKRGTLTAISGIFQSIARRALPFSVNSIQAVPQSAHNTHQSLSRDNPPKVVTETTRSAFKPVLKLTHFGGTSFYSYPWTSDLSSVQVAMSQVICQHGLTQICRVFEETIHQATKGPIAAVIYTGDAMEEDGGLILSLAERLRKNAIPVYMFQEGDDPHAAEYYAQISTITGGVHVPFKTGSFSVLRSLMKAVIAHHSHDPVLIEAARSDNSLPRDVRQRLLPRTPG